MKSILNKQALLAFVMAAFAVGSVSGMQNQNNQISDDVIEGWNGYSYSLSITFLTSSTFPYQNQITQRWQGADPSQYQTPQVHEAGVKATRKACYKQMLAYIKSIQDWLNTHRTDVLANDVENKLKSAQKAAKAYAEKYDLVDSWFDSLLPEVSMKTGITVPFALFACYQIYKAVGTPMLDYGYDIAKAVAKPLYDNAESVSWTAGMIFGSIAAACYVPRLIADYAKKGMGAIGKKLTDFSRV